MDLRDHDVKTLERNMRSIRLVQERIEEGVSAHEEEMLRIVVGTFTARARKSADYIESTHELDRPQRAILQKVRTTLENPTVEKLQDALRNTCNMKRPAEQNIFRRPRGRTAAENRHKR